MSHQLFQPLHGDTLRPELPRAKTAVLETLEEGDILDRQAIDHMPTAYTRVATDAGLIAVLDWQPIKPRDFYALTFISDRPGYAGIAIVDLSDIDTSWTVAGRTRVETYDVSMTYDDAIYGTAAYRTEDFQEQEAATLQRGDFVLAKSIPEYPGSLTSDWGDKRCWIVDSYLLEGVDQWHVVLSVAFCHEWVTTVVVDSDMTMQAADGDLLSVGGSAQMYHCPECGRYGTLGYESPRCRECGHLVKYFDDPEAAD